MKNYINKIINENIEMKQQMIKNNINDIIAICNEIISAYKKGKKIVVFGNGGSAADSQHFAAELVCRFEEERPALNAIALTTNTSIITATGNDYTFDNIFSRQVEAVVNEGDVVIGISTSGNSKSVIEGIKQAKKQKAITIGLTGQDGGKMKDLVDISLRVPSKNTARIQEGHILIIHIISKILEEKVFK